MPAKSYRTYNLCIALHHIIARECVALSSSGGTKRKKEREKKLFLPIFIFSISEIGSGANPDSPGWGGGGWRRSLGVPSIRPCFWQWDPRAEKGGPDLCFNMGPGSETGSRSSQ